MPSIGESAIRGLTQGFTSGTQLGLQIQEQKAKVDARLAGIQKEKEAKVQQDFENKLKLGTQLTDAYNVNTEAGQKIAIEGALQLYRDMGYPVPENVNTEGVDFSAPMKELTNALRGFTGKTTAGGNKELLFAGVDSAFEMATKLLPEDRLERFEERAGERVAGVEKEREQALLGQVARLPGLEKAEVITPAQAEEARITGLGEAGELAVPKAATLTELKAEVFENLPEKDKRRALLKPDVEINLGKPASAGERTAIAETRASIDALNNLKSLFDTEFVGPAGGRISAIKNVFGLNPAKQEAFIAATSAFKNQVIKQITGAQMSEQEAERIMKQIPTETDAPSVWLAKFEQSIKNLKTVNDRRQEVLRQSGIRSPEDLQEGSIEDLSTLSNEELLKRLAQ